MKHLNIYSSPKVSGGEPNPSQSGARVIDLLDRIDAGDSIEEVAKDFSCDPGSLELLLELREVLRPQSVYIAECKVYAESYVSGVYLSAEAAMEAHPLSTADAARERDVGRKPGWRKVGEGKWTNGCDHGLAVRVFEQRVEPPEAHQGEKA